MLLVITGKNLFPANISTVNRCNLQPCAFKDINFMGLFRDLSWFFRDQWRTYTLALMMLAAVASLNMLIPWLVAQAVDALSQTPLTLSAVEPFLLGLGGAGVTIYALRIGWRRVLFGTAYRLGHRLRKSFYQRLLGQGQAFYAAHNTGDLMAQATNDIDAIEVAAGEGILSGFDGALTFVLVLVMMFAVIDWRLTLVALIPFPVMAWGFQRIGHSIHRYFHQALERFSELNDHTQESMTGIRLTRVMGLESIHGERFDQISEDAARANYAVARSEAMYEPVVFLCMGASMLLTLTYGGYLVVSGSLSVGELTGFTLYLVQLIWPMFAFGWLLNIIERGSAAWKRVDRLLQTPDSIPDEGTHEFTAPRFEVTNLVFAPQAGSPPALDGVSLRLEPGQRLGIAGPTGAGKSLLLQLLMRYWESPDPTMIQLEGRPLNEYRLPSLRGAFAYVPQDPFLFSLTVGENIALYRPDASDDEIMEAARAAAIDQEIEHFPYGLDTPVGERGISLSGGQRQRLAIARALLSKAPILVLDDTLSAVDTRTERRILEQLERHGDNRTVLVVSHRLSALSHCDRIMVLAHGECIESGSHDELLAADGWYARMWTYQQLEADLDAH